MRTYSGDDLARMASYADRIRTSGQPSIYRLSEYPIQAVSQHASLDYHSQVRHSIQASSSPKCEECRAEGAASTGREDLDVDGVSLGDCEGRASKRTVARETTHSIATSQQFGRVDLTSTPVLVDRPRIAAEAVTTFRLPGQTMVLPSTPGAVSRPPRYSVPGQHHRDPESWRPHDGPPQTLRCDCVPKDIEVGQLRPLTKEESKLKFKKGRVPVALPHGEQVEHVVEGEVDYTHPESRRRYRVWMTATILEVTFLARTLHNGKSCLAMLDNVARDVANS